MGYYMSSREVDIVIYDPEGALAAVKALCARERNFAWVNNKACRDVETLEAAMEHWRWPLVRHGGGPWEVDCFAGEKLGDDLELFKALAPFVRAGSFVEMQGEDDDFWRWTFDGKDCRRIDPCVTWPGMPAKENQ